MRTNSDLGPGLITHLEQMELREVMSVYKTGNANKADDKGGQVRQHPGSSSTTNPQPPGAEVQTVSGQASPLCPAQSVPVEVEDPFAATTHTSMAALPHCHTNANSKALLNSTAGHSNYEGRLWVRPPRGSGEREAGKAGVEAAAGQTGADAGYLVLRRFPVSSDDRRCTSVVRHPDGRLLVFIKGGCALCFFYLTCV